MKKNYFIPALSALFALVLGVATLTGTTSPASAAACVPAKPVGKTVGKIVVGNISMPIKAFIYPAGGTMKPPGSTLMAGLSQRHMPLSSTLGSSILTWHRDYNGCWNELNVFTTKKVGSKFSITDEKGATKQYKISAMKKVKKGNYDASWFDLIGPRKVVLITCIGDFKDGHYENNLVVIAQPI